MRNEWIGRRQAVRQTCHMRAEMRFLDGRVPIECTVIDISATGARVQLPDGFECPEDFDLFIPSRSETKIAKMRRQEDNVAGVAFLKSRHEDPLVLQSIVERLARLERGYSELKKAGFPAAAGERRHDDAPQAELPLLPEAAIAPELIGAGTAHLEQRLDALAESLADLQTTFVMSIARREPQIDHSTDIQVLKSQLADLTAAVNANGGATPDVSVPAAQVAAMLAPVAETQQDVVELKSEMERLSAALGALIEPAAEDQAPVEAPSQASAEDNQKTQLQLTQLKAELAELRTAIPQHVVEPVTAAPAAVARDATEDQNGQLEAEVRDLRDSVRTLIMLVAKSLNEKTREAA
ncbi:PilZ domain-containing protein [Roseiarcaceae bacterium H3SJ34-1]|uniref:PilZ domain-containing protein n=1 Tax=Terripilifer ovatus TaxID=3032367 RepID=UPI003AB94AEE|nr:PilZ domain-containing protein [Roseiarcaceae bacterium H3SJ34-1]